MSTASSTKVMLVDDHKIMRDGLRMTLETIDRMEVVGEAGDGASAVKLANELKPDLVVMDVMMPGMNGIDACWEITDQLPDTKVVMLTASGDKEAITQAAVAGAEGYVPKYSGSDELVQTLINVVDGKYEMPRSARRWAMAIARDSVQDEKLRELGMLTDREREILKHLAQGYTYKEIAAIRVISPFTVRNAVTGILNKLGLDNRSQLVAWAVERDLLR